MLGIAAGLFVGKQVGIFGAIWGREQAGHRAAARAGSSWAQIYGMALVAGIGFTMSLFIGGLAFAGSGAWSTRSRSACSAGSLLSALGGVSCCAGSTSSAGHYDAHRGRHTDAILRPPRRRATRRRVELHNGGFTAYAETPGAGRRDPGRDRPGRSAGGSRRGADPGGPHAAYVDFLKAAPRLWREAGRGGRCDPLCLSDRRPPRR